MTPEREELVFRDVLQMVIWGSSEEDVMHKLEINEITGEWARELYKRARQERIGMLRSDAVQTAIKGGLLLAGGIGLFCFFWFELGFTTRLIMALSALGCIVGGWRLLSGVMDFILASAKKGSIAD